MDSAQFDKILDALKVSFDSLAHSLERNLQAKIDARDVILAAIKQNNVRFPTFSGDASESVHEYIAEFKRVQN